ncbi:MAG: hypothetical protein Q8M08_02565 [Bacteroidales bacterium]|nr:hypothetical protein [Bacteroidales bacterium]
MNTNNQVTVLADKAMPAAFKTAELTFNAGKNIFLTQGYTSQAGNTYYQGVRFSDRIIITQQLGQGYYYTFLNGIRIFGFNGKEVTLIAEKSFHCCVYSESYVKSESENLIKDFLKSQAAISGSMVDIQQLDTFAQSLVAETMKNQIPYRNQLKA